MGQRVEFLVGGWRYVWSVTDDHQVAFALEDSNYKLRLVPMEDLMLGWDDDDIVTSTEDIGVCPKPVEVMRRVMELTAQWIKSSRPSYFWIQAASDKKRRLYRRMADRLSPSLLQGFQIVPYDQAIYFYKDMTAVEPTTQRQLEAA